MENSETAKNWGLSGTPWLVKSGGRILGPYISDQIVQKLRGKEFGPLDEITNCFGRWRYIRDEREFELVLNEIKNRMEKADSTTDSISTTQTETDVLEQTEITQFRGHDRLVQGIEEQVSRAEVGEKISSEARVYGLEGDARVEAHVHRMGGQAWIWGICLVLSAGIIWGIVKSRKAENEFVSNDPAVLVAQGSEFEKRGDYKRAKDRIERVAAFRPNDLEIKLRLAPLMVWDGNSVGAKRLAEEVLQSQNASALNLATAHTIIAVTALNSQDSILSESELKEAISKKEDFLPALFNKAVLQTRIGSFAAAAKEYESILGKGPASSLSVLGYSEAALKLSDKKMEAKALQEIESQLERSNDFRQELLVMKAALFAQMEDRDAANRAILEALDIDPDETSDHIHEPMYVDDYSNWSSLKKIVIGIKEKLETNPSIQALLGYATYRAGDRTEGKYIVEGALQTDNNDNAILALKAFMLMRSGVREEFQVTLALARQNSKRALPLLLQARSCFDEEKNACARESWLDTLKVDARSVRAMAGLAALSIQGGDMGSATRLIDAGLKFSPSFKPLLELTTSLHGKRSRESSQ